MTLGHRGNLANERSHGAVSRREYLEKSARLLWPEPGAVTFGGRRRVPGSNDYALLPNGTEPKVMVPLASRAVTAAALANYQTAATSRLRAYLRALSLAGRMGLAGWLPDHVHIATSDTADTDGIDRHLGRCLQRSVYVSLYVGPPRANRKPVLQVVSAQGRTVAFAKIGVDALTRELVRNEAAALADLSGRVFARVLIPRVLHSGAWNGHRVLVQAAVRGTGSSPDPEALQRAMLEIAHLHSTPTHLAASSPYWRGLRDRVLALPPSRSAAALAHMLPALEALAACTRIQLGSWHGDWTPWNMTALGAAVAVWDWERFQSNVPWGFDALHHCLQASIVRGKADPAQRAAALPRQAPGLLAPFGVEPAPATFTALLYLVEIATRYLHDDLAAAGGRLGALDTWLLPALSLHLGTAADVRGGG